MNTISGCSIGHSTSTTLWPSSNMLGVPSAAGGLSLISSSSSLNNTSLNNNLSVQMPSSCKSNFKLAAPKPVRARAAPSTLLNATKWFQASPIKTEIDEKIDLLTEGRRDSSVQS